MYVVCQIRLAKLSFLPAFQNSFVVVIIPVNADNYRNAICKAHRNYKLAKAL